MPAGKLFQIARHPLFKVIAVPVAGLMTLWLVNALWPRPRNLGVRDGRLAACPDRPNCVNSQAEDAEHAIEPLRFQGSPVAAKEQLKAMLGGLPRVRLVEERGDYLRYEFVSRVCRFVDDVEFLVVPGQSLIHVRSASRVGVSDLGVNRQRVEMIRRRLGW